jgi:hypothetical protein
MSIDRTKAAARLTRIDHMIEEYRRAKQNQLLRRAIKVWHKAEARQRIVELDAPTERIH